MLHLSILKGADDKKEVASIFPTFGKLVQTPPPVSSVIVVSKAHLGFPRHMLGLLSASSRCLMLVQCFNDRDEGAEDDDRHNFYGEIESWRWNNFSPPLF